MNVVSTIDYIAPSPTVVALGCFDGVHLGHQAVIGKAKELAHRTGCACAVWTFTEPPRNFFAPHSVPLITDQMQKAELIEELGVDCFLCVPFDRTISAMSAEDFFRVILLERLQATHLVCGFNYSFGAGGKGDVALLEKLCRSAKVGLTVLPPVTLGAVAVSSSAIRQAMENGRPEDAAAALGRPYALRTLVVDGQKLARRLGFPTLNQIFPEGMLIPRYGVYVSRVTTEGDTVARYGISNVGLRPTVGGSLLCSETHIFDFSGDLYGKWVKVEFLAFLRNEVKFDSLQHLTEQVNADIEQAKEIIATNPFNC